MRDAGAGDHPVANGYDAKSSAPSGGDTTDLSPGLPARLRTLLDRQEIADVVARYCRGIDRRDFDLVRTCYHPDGTDRHTGFLGGIDWTRKEPGQFVPREGEGPTGAPSTADPLYRLPGWPSAERLDPSPRSPLGAPPGLPG